METFFLNKYCAITYIHGLIPDVTSPTFFSGFTHYVRLQTKPGSN